MNIIKNSFESPEKPDFFDIALRKRLNCTEMLLKWNLDKLTSFEFFESLHVFFDFIASQD
jgi:hypothetical protein